MIAIPLVLLFAGNICYTLLSDALYSMKGIFATDMAANNHLPAIINFPKSSNYYLILFGLTIFLEIALPYKIRTAYNDFNVNQKGGERFAYLEELYEQYPAVPEKDQFYQGKGGVPIAWDRNHHKVLIDRSAETTTSSAQRDPVRANLLCFRRLTCIPVRKLNLHLS